jgi:hypothetical protein
MQGMLAHCWFPIVAIGEWPERIKSVFRSTEYSKNGIFELNMYMYGIPHKVVVDDKLPKYEDQWLLAR